MQSPRCTSDLNQMSLHSRCSVHAISLDDDSEWHRQKLELKNIYNEIYSL